MVKRGSHYICMFIIYLLIMPVLYSADAFAYFNAEIHGYDGITGFRRASSDITVINVTAGIPGQSIDESQIKLLTDPTQRFECIFNNETTLHECELVVPGNLPPGPHDYEVQLFNKDMTEAEPKQILTIVADNLPPDIHSFGLQRNGSDIYAEFRLSDRACEICNPQVCAGIDHAEILLNYQKVGEFFPDRVSCTIPLNRTRLNIPPTPGTTTKTICIDAYDRLGQKSSRCNEITMDFSPPQLVNASIWHGDDKLRFTKGEPIADVTLKAYITEESGLNISTLVADFSSLNARDEFSQIYRHIDMSDINRQRFEPSCIKESNTTYLCTWKNLLIYLPEGSSPEVRLSALDSFSNVMNDTFTLPFIFDDTGPLITGARTGIADDVGRYWVGKGNNTIYIDLEETGAGFDDKHLFLDFSSFGPQPFAEGNETLSPNECVPGWTCVFDLVNVVKEYSSGTVLPVNVVMESSDDAGNAVRGMTTMGFYYDNEPPEIVSVENSSVCPTAPDDIEITVTVSELYSGGVTAKASAPDLSADAFPIDEECEETETKGTWVCDIVIGNLFTYYTQGDINLTLTDRAGNSKTTTLHQEVCEAAPGVPPNVVRKVRKVKLFPPEGIDRKVADKVPFPLFWQPDPKFQSGNAEIQDIKIDNCNLSAGTASDLYILTPLNKENPMFGMKVGLDPAALSVENESAIVDSITVDCQLSLTVRSGRKVYQQPEIEVVEFEVPLYSTIFGELNESMQEELGNIEDKIKGKQSEIDSLAAWIDAFGWVCSIGQLMMKLVMIMQALKILLYAVGWVVAGVTWSVSNGGYVYYTPCLVVDYVTTALVTNLWQVDSLSFDSPGLYFKYLCGVMTCRFTEGSNFIELLGHLGRTNSGQYSGEVDGVDKEGKRNSFSREEINADVSQDDFWATAVWAGDNTFSAYRNLIVAKYTVCFPAQLYAKKKEKQILCMYRNCYKDLVAAGFSPEICQRLYEGRQCLYVDGAASKVTDIQAWEIILNGIIQTVLTQAPGTAASVGLRAAYCGYPQGLSTISLAMNADRVNCGLFPEAGLTYGWHALVCGAGIMTTLWTDIGDWLHWDDFGNVYDTSLGNPDYCELGDDE